MSPFHSHRRFPRLFLKGGACALAFALALPPAARADDNAPISPQVKTCVDRAVAWLMTQQRTQGCFFTDNRNEPVPSHSGALTALALMGLASVGHMPADPTPEGKAMAKAIRFMTDSIIPNEEGYLGQTDHSRMYGHGIISLMYAEMLGQTQDEEIDKKIRARLQRSVEMIMRSQEVIKAEANRGGWRYEPGSSDADISVTVWQVMTLRAAKNAGLDVPKNAIDNAIAYIKRSYRSERDANGAPKDLEAAFSYEPYGGRQGFSTTAAGVLALQVCGQYEAPEVIGGANYLVRNPPAPSEAWFFYGTYYYAQCMYQRGGDQAAQARQRTEAMLIKNQSENGSWKPENGNERSEGPIYATSLALLSLSVHHHFLPIYQK